MINNHRWRPQLRAVLGVLVVAMLACVVAALVIVFRNVDASGEMRKEAREAVLLAEMDTAVQSIGVSVDAWVSNGAVTASDGHPVLGSADVQQHLLAVDTATAELDLLIKPDERYLIANMRRLLSDYLAALEGLQVKSETGVDILEEYHAEVQPIERSYREAVIDLQNEEIEHLEESAVAAGAAESRLRWLVPVLFALVIALAEGIRRLGQRVRRSEDAELLNRSRTEFIASVSHELRTPLSTVVGLAHEMRDELASFEAEEIEEFAGLIAVESSEVAGIVEDLLVAARVDTGNLSVLREGVDLRAEVEQVATSEHALTNCNVRITGDASAAADGARVRQILRNLLTNAARYGGEDIEVGLEQRHAEVRLVVTDDGPGISDEDRERIFRPFERAHETPGVAASVGLGLTVSRQLARAMGGDLRYDYNGRSCFEMTLPGVEAMSGT